MSVNADLSLTPPWASQSDAAACDRAFHELASGLPGQFSLEGRVHVPTLLCGAGAVAGFCAHVSLISDPAAMHDATQAGALAAVKRPNGEELLVGDAINLMLCTADQPLASARLWNVLAGVSAASGVDEKALPQLDGMFARAARALSTPEEGFPAVPEDFRPQMSARETLRVAGPFAVMCLTGRIGEGGQPAAETSWVAIAAQAAGSVLSRTSSSLPPEIGAQIVMEAAIAVSKLRPRLPAGDQA